MTEEQAARLSKLMAQIDADDFHLTRREARGLTQVQLAAKAKMKQPYVAQLETGAEPNPLARQAAAVGEDAQVHDLGACGVKVKGDSQ